MSFHPVEALKLFATDISAIDRVKLDIEKAWKTQRTLFHKQISVGRCVYSTIEKPFHLENHTAAQDFQ